MSLQDELCEQLTRRGWSVVRHTDDLEWWAREIWLLESVWAPHGFRLYVTLLSDPLPGQEPFYNIGTCRRWPEDRDEADGEPSMLFRGWVENLPAFLDAMDACRKTG